MIEHRQKNTGALLLTAAFLALLHAGACSSDERAAPAGRMPGGRPGPDRPQSPYYYGIIEEHRNVLAEDPHNLAAVIGLANALYDAGQWRQAIQYYERALRLDPHLTDVITDMGTCYRNLGMIDKAIALYQQTLALEPVHQNALFNLGVVYGFDKKDYAQAIKFWDQLLHVAPKHPKADYLQANIAQFRNAAKKGAGR